MTEPITPAAPEDFAPTNDTPVTEKTPEQKEALAELFGCGKTAPEEMSDAELVEALAEFMGWRWYKVATVAALVPPWRQKEFDDHPAIYAAIESTDGLKRNHFDGVFLTNPHDFPPPPPYLTDWNDTMEVVMKLTDHDTWAFSLESYFPKWLASFDHMESDKEVLTKESDPQRAILSAALHAVRSSPSPNA